MGYPKKSHTLAADPDMAIPKIIHQTFKNADLPFITRWNISRMKNRNPEYQYEFYDDKRILEFIEQEYGNKILNSYKLIQIGAAKADFFRYLVLYKKGGVYLDIDSLIKGRLSDFIRGDDTAIISCERNPGLFVQWALVFSAGHPFLEKTIELVQRNIEQNRFPNDVHKMTGPSVFTEAVNICISENPDVEHRVLGIDYNGHMKFKYLLSKLLYPKGQHWKKMQLQTTVLNSKPNDS